MLKLHDLAPGVFPHAKWLRESELKHCRIAMLASVGAFSAQYGLTIPGYTANVDPVTNLNAFVLDWPFGFTQVCIASNCIVSSAVMLYAIIFMTGTPAIFFFCNLSE